MWNLQVCPEDLTPRVRVVCFSMPSEPCNHIPITYQDFHWGNRLCTCVWACWLPDSDYQMRWIGTGRVPAAISCERPACFRNPKGWNKALAVRTKKGGTGWVLKELLGCTILWATERKMQILPARSSAQLHTQDVSPQCPRIFQKDLGSLDFFYRDNVMGPTFGCWFHFPCAFGGLPCGHTFRGNCYWKMTSKQAFSICMLPLAHRMVGKLWFFEEGKALMESVYSGFYQSRTV